MDTMDRIDKILKENGISRRELAHKAGIPNSTLGRLFTNHPDHLPYKYGFKIANALNITTEELYDDPIPSAVVLHAGMNPEFLTGEDLDDPDKMLMQIVRAYNKYLRIQDKRDLYIFAMKQLFDNDSLQPDRS